MPTGIIDCQRNMNPSLVEALLMAGVWHCIPFLLKWSNNESKSQPSKLFTKNIKLIPTSNSISGELLKITEKDLRDAGLTDPQDCENILKAFRMYAKQKYAQQTSWSSVEEMGATPSAPIEEIEEASAPPMESTGYATNECVICLDVHVSYSNK